MKENQTGGAPSNFEHADEMCGILKDDPSVKPHATIDTISVNKKRVYDNLLDMNNNVKTVKKKKVNNDKTGINEIIKQKIEEEREWHKEEKEWKEKMMKESNETKRETINVLKGLGELLKDIYNDIKQKE